MTATRTESDSFGPLEVPADKYWGAQTQRSLSNFPIGWEKQPVAIVRALGVIKQAAAHTRVRRARPTGLTSESGPLQRPQPPMNARDSPARRVGAVGGVWWLTFCVTSVLQRPITLIMNV